jgi:hypothetical protein
MWKPLDASQPDFRSLFRISSSPPGDAAANAIKGCLSRPRRVNVRADATVDDLGKSPSPAGRCPVPQPPRGHLRPGGEGYSVQPGFSPASSKGPS